MRIARRLKTNSGIILVVTVWILMILTLLALGIGRQTRVDLALSKYKLGKMRSKSAAWSGVFYSIDLLSRSVGLSGNAPEEDVKHLFTGFETPYGGFEISEIRLGPDGKKRAEYGFSDEGGRLNLNALTLQTSTILKELILVLGYDEKTAETVSVSLIDWIDADSNLADRSLGAEDEYYKRLERPYHCKNIFLESVQELLSVRGMSGPLWRDLKPHVTIFPSQGPLKINFSTASKPVLLALARNFSGARSNTDVADAESLVEKILEYRAGADSQERTADDRPVVLSEIALNAKEKTLASLFVPYEAKTPQFVRMNIRATGRPLDVQTRLTSVIRLSDLSIVFWQTDAEGDEE